MNNLIEKDYKLENMIYEIRGKQVMLDSDLAELYKVETKRINEAVKNNPMKFPERYSWILTDDEKDNLWSKFSTANLSNMSRVNPRVFTEQGVYMLATILKSKVANDTTIRIMDSFVAMRHYLIENKDIYKTLNNINNKVIEHDDKLEYLFSRFSLNGKEFLKGDFYLEYSYIKDIVELAKKEIIIIDPYVDKKTLDLIRDLNISIKIICSSKAKLTKTEIKEFNKSYNNLEAIENNSFHDRFIIVDNKDIYHIGTSINYAGNKFTIIDKLEDKYLKEAVLNEIKKI